MTTSFGPGCDNDMQAQARASHRGQSPGFQGSRIGELLITALYDGFVPVPADDLHGAPPAEIYRLLAEAFLPPEGDQRTAVIAFLVEHNGLQIMIDAGSGDSLGTDTGCLATNLATAQIVAAEIDHVLLGTGQSHHAGPRSGTRGDTAIGDRIKPLTSQLSAGEQKRLTALLTKALGL